MNMFNHYFADGFLVYHNVSHSKNPCVPKVVLGLDHPDVGAWLCLDGNFASKPQSPSKPKSEKMESVLISSDSRCWDISFNEKEEEDGERTGSLRDSMADREVSERLLPNGDSFQEQGTLSSVSSK